MKINCPACKVSLKVHQKHSGKTLKCPKCAGAIMVPELPLQEMAAQPIPVAKPIKDMGQQPPTDEIPMARSKGDLGKLLKTYKSNNREARGNWIFIAMFGLCGLALIVGGFFVPGFLVLMIIGGLFFFGLCYLGIYVMPKPFELALHENGLEFSQSGKEKVKTAFWEQTNLYEAREKIHINTNLYRLGLDVVGSKEKIQFVCMHVNEGSELREKVLAKVKPLIFAQWDKALQEGEQSSIGPVKVCRQGVIVQGNLIQWRLTSNVVIRNNDHQISFTAPGAVNKIAKLGGILKGVHTNLHPMAFPNLYLLGEYAKLRKLTRF